MKIFYNEEEIPEGIPVIANSDPETLLKQLISEVNKNGAQLRASQFRYVVILKEVETRENLAEIDLWIRENVRKPSAVALDSYRCNLNFFFTDETDALGFKLMWME